MFEIAKQISDVVFHWCGVWLVMNGVTKVVEAVKDHFWQGEMNRELGAIVQKITELEATLEKCEKDDEGEPEEDSGEDEESEVPA